ncbi:MAG: Head fiber protein [bacterium LCO1.1]|jgi:hypothetical protein|uniref:Head fiber protein n=1 Tax=Candidatus Weimeria bifida TaxID=2599074 RepID=A0A6N7IW61_9FIRM|nr:Head fiber protein [Candidatus Weimeria bifida]
MSYNAKNYTEQGGDVTHIGGTLIIEEGATVEGLPSSFTPAENQADSEAETVDALKEEFNGLLAKLKTAGLMEADAEPETDAT